MNLSKKKLVGFKNQKKGALLNQLGKKFQKKLLFLDFFEAIVKLVNALFFFIFSPAL